MVTVSPEVSGTIVTPASDFLHLSLTDAEFISVPNYPVENVKVYLHMMVVVEVSRDSNHKLENSFNCQFRKKNSSVFGSLKFFLFS